LEMSVFQMLSPGKTGHPAIIGPDFAWIFTVVVVVAGRARRTVVTGDCDGLGPTEVVVCDGMAVVEVDVGAVLDVVVNSGAPPGERPLRPEADRWPELQDARRAVTITPAVQPAH